MCPPPSLKCVAGTPSLLGLSNIYVVVKSDEQSVDIKVDIKVSKNAVQGGNQLGREVECVSKCQKTSRR